MYKEHAQKFHCLVVLSASCVQEAILLVCLFKDLLFTLPLNRRGPSRVAEGNIMALSSEVIRGLSLLQLITAVTCNSCRVLGNPAGRPTCSEAVQPKHRIFLSSQIERNVNS